MEEVPESLRYPKSEESASEDCVIQKENELLDDNSTSVTVKDMKEGNSEMRLGYIGMGLHDKLEVLEAKKLLEVAGQIDRKPARILLDTGCSTYVLSTRFATQHKIERIPISSRPVNLAIGDAKA